MEETKTNAGRGLGITGLVLGIVSLLISIIPRVGLFALVPGIIAISFSIIALKQANRANGSKVIIILALIISILGTSFAALWIFNITSSDNTQKKEIETGIERDDNGSIDENTNNLNSKLEKTMEELESDSSSTKIKLHKGMSDTEFNKYCSAYERIIVEALKYHEDIKTGDSDAVMKYSNVSVKLARMTGEISLASQDLTKDQNKKFEELNKKYREILNSLKK
jgi:ascorbate-specific PTS system EIIC-type component UlaA